MSILFCTGQKGAKIDKGEDFSFVNERVEELTNSVVRDEAKLKVTRDGVFFSRFTGIYNYQGLEQFEIACLRD